MNELTKAVRVGIAGVFYSLTHVPDLVCYGSKPSREIKTNPNTGAALKERLRSFPAATAYAPHQVYIGNVTPEELSGLPKPWYEKLIEGVSRQGRFGDLVDQSRFYGLLAASDQFELVSFEEKWFAEQAAGESTDGRKLRLRSVEEIKALCDKGAFQLRSGDMLVGAFEAG